MPTEIKATYVVMILVRGFWEQYASPCKYFADAVGLRVEAERAGRTACIRTVAAD